MKHTKKALALLVALVMSLSLLTATAFAEGTSKITITNAQYGLTYQLYKLFDVSADLSGSDEPAGATYSIKSTDPWYSLVSAEGSPFYGKLKEDTHASTSEYTVYSLDLSNNVATPDLTSWLKTLGDNNTLPPPDKSVKATGTTVEFTGLEPGYYYVRGDNNTLIAISHSGDDRQIIDKTQQPGWGTDPDDSGKSGGKFIKTGANGSGTEYSKNGTADVGGKLDYKVVAYSATNYYKDKQIKEYVIEDTETGAVFIDFNSITVKVNDVEYKKGWLEGTGVAPDGASMNDTSLGTWDAGATATKAAADWYVVNADNTDLKFSICINWMNTDGTPKFPNDGKANKIEVTYQGVLKSANVVYGDNGNNNTATLKVITKDGTTTQVGEPNTAKAVTYSAALFKYTGTTTTKTPLAGAEFMIQWKDAAGALETLSFYPSKDYDGVYYLANDENWDSEHVDHSDSAKKDSMKTSTVVSPSDGYIVLRGLAGGEYTVTETKAPSGYTKLSAPLTYTLANAGGGVSLRKQSKTGSTVGQMNLTNVHVEEVQNNAGTVLPETGGIGTTLFVAIGAAAVIGTGLFLVTNKRISKEDI